jgi:hypothetical protein
VIDLKGVCGFVGINWGIIVHNFSSSIFLQMSDKDIEQEVRDWEETQTHADIDEGNAAAAANGEAEKDDAGAAEKGKEVIDVEAEDEKKRKPMTSRSTMWDHFTKIYDKGELIKGKCNYCNSEIAARPTLNGTSAMRKHFNTCRKNPRRVSDDDKQGVLSVTKGEGSSVVTWKFDPDLLRSAYAEMIIEDEEPFCRGEKPGFKKFMSLACPRFIIPSKRTTLGTMSSCTLSKKKNLECFQEHCNRICLTIDGWTSQQNDSYMTVTTHFIDKEWCLHKKIISFFKVKDKKGDDIGKHL